MGIYGFTAGAPMLMLVALFVYLGAGAEASAVETRLAGEGISVAQMMVTDFRTIPIHATLSPGGGAASRRRAAGVPRRRQSGPNRGAPHPGQPDPWFALGEPDVDRGRGDDGGCAHRRLQPRISTSARPVAILGTPGAPGGGWRYARRAPDPRQHHRSAARPPCGARPRPSRARSCLLSMVPRDHRHPSPASGSHLAKPTHAILAVLQRRRSEGNSNGVLERGDDAEEEQAARSGRRRDPSAAGPLGATSCPCASSRSAKSRRSCVSLSSWRSWLTSISSSFEPGRELILGGAPPQALGPEPEGQRERRVNRGVYWLGGPGGEPDGDHVDHAQHDGDRVPNRGLEGHGAYFSTISARKAADRACRSHRMTPHTFAKVSTSVRCRITPRRPDPPGRVPTIGPRRKETERIPAGSSRASARSTAGPSEGCELSPCGRKRPTSHQEVALEVHHRQGPAPPARLLERESALALGAFEPHIARQRVHDEPESKTLVKGSGCGDIHRRQRDLVQVHEAIPSMTASLRLTMDPNHSHGGSVTRRRHPFPPGSPYPLPNAGRPRTTLHPQPPRGGHHVREPRTLVAPGRAGASLAVPAATLATLWELLATPVPGKVVAAHIAADADSAALEGLLDRLVTQAFVLRGAMDELPNSPPNLPRPNPPPTSPAPASSSASPAPCRPRSSPP